MERDEIRAFVESQVSRAWNGFEEQDAAVEDIVDKWWQDRESHGDERWDEGYDAGSSYERTEAASNG
jgi:hypothetical protein